MGLRPLPAARFPAGWHQTVPWDVPPAGPEYFKMTIPLGAATERLVTKDYRPGSYVVRSDERPLVKVTVEGFGRVTDGKTDWPHPSGQWFCFGGKCECPEGQHEKAAIPAHADIGDKLYAGLAAGPAFGAGARAARDVRVLRGRRAAAAAAGGGGDAGGGGGSNGDPHLTTNDGVRYDFQAAGEFVLARGPGLEVQARQEPWEKSKYASINTQFAFRVGTARVTIAAGDTMEVRVGAPCAADRAPVGLPGGGRIEPRIADRLLGPRAHVARRLAGVRLVRRRVGRRAPAAAVGRRPRQARRPARQRRRQRRERLRRADGKQLDAAALRKSAPPRSSSCTASSASRGG